MTPQQKCIQWMLLGFGTIFLIVGVILFAGGIRTAKATQKVEATITSVKKETKTVVKKRRHKTQTVYRVTVDYTYDGKEYKDISCPFGSSSMKEGQSLTISIDPANPQEVKSSSVLFLVGGIFCLTAVLFLVFFVVVRRREKRLRTE